MSESKPTYQMNIKLLLIASLLFIIAGQEAHSQYGVSHEVGVIIGPVMFKSDYGQRKDFETNTKNSGFGIGIVHYLNFAYQSRSYFNEHFKIRSELDYITASFEHYGEWVADDKQSDGAKQLRAMSGSTTVIEVGSLLEYYPLSIIDFEYANYKLAPYFGLGVHYVNFSPKAETSWGDRDIHNPANYPSKYKNAFQTESGSTWALVCSLGVRYKLTKMSDLMLDTRWSMYSSDYVDGLSPSLGNNGTTPVPENKANDWIFWLNLGYVFYLD